MVKRKKKTGSPPPPQVVDLPAAVVAGKPKKGDKNVRIETHKLKLVSVSNNDEVFDFESGEKIRSTMALDNTKIINDDLAGMLAENARFSNSHDEIQTLVDEKIQGVMESKEKSGSKVIVSENADLNFGNDFSGEFAGNSRPNFSGDGFSIQGMENDPYNKGMLMEGSVKDLESDIMKTKGKLKGPNGLNGEGALLLSDVGSSFMGDEATSEIGTLKTNVRSINKQIGHGEIANDHALQVFDNLPEPQTKLIGKNPADGVPISDLGRDPCNMVKLTQGSLKEMGSGNGKTQGFLGGPKVDEDGYLEECSSAVFITLGDQDTSEDKSTGTRRNVRIANEQMSHGKIGNDHAPKVLDQMPQQGLKSSTPWKDLFSANRKVGNDMKLHLRQSNGGKVKFTAEDIDDVVEAWGHALVGYIAGRSPGKGAIISFCKSWNVKHKIYFDASGWIVVKFENEGDRDGVLAKGPYMIYGRPFMIKTMPHLFSFKSEKTTIVPIWVRFPELPRAFWNENALSILASEIGVPTQTDNFTSTKERVSFARVLVEVDVSKELLSEIEVELPDGDNSFMQEVVYEAAPSYCSRCRAIGHSTVVCERRREALLALKNGPKKIAPETITAGGVEVVDKQIGAQAYDNSVVRIEEALETDREKENRASRENTTFTRPARPIPDRAFGGNQHFRKPGSFTRSVKHLPDRVFEKKQAGHFTRSVRTSPDRISEKNKAATVTRSVGNLSDRVFEDMQHIRPSIIRSSVSESAAFFGFISSF